MPADIASLRDRPLIEIDPDVIAPGRSSAYLAGWKSPSGKGKPPTRIEC